MNSLPQQIMQAELDQLDQAERLKANRGRLRGIEVDKTIEVADAKHDNGKPVFTNEISRTAAVERLCAEDDTYQKLLAEIRKDEHDSKVTESVLGKLKMEFKLHLLDREEHVRRMDALSLREELRRLVYGDTPDKADVEHQYDRVQRVVKSVLDEKKAQSKPEPEVPF